MWSMWTAGEAQANVIQAAADAFEKETGAHVNISGRAAMSTPCCPLLWSPAKAGHLRG